MLGIKLKADEEARFERYARELRRPKSALAREWILERLDREATDREFLRQVALLDDGLTAGERAEHKANSAAILRALDEEDGGYDWGPDGPPQ